MRLLISMDLNAFDPFRAHIRAFIHDKRLFHPGGRTVVGVSGGVDSTVLVVVLQDIAREMGFDLVLAHLNHGLRGEESLRDECFVRELAGERNVPIEIERIEDFPRHLKRGESVQMGARRLRYAFLERVRCRVGASTIALAHTRSDQAETVLMRLSSGAGLLGLSGIPVVRDARIVRPLLDVSRRDVLDFASRHRLRWVEDSSNADPKYVRNKMRTEIIPVLETINPAIETALSRCAELARADNAYLEREATEALARIQRSPTREDVGCALERRLFADLHPALQRRVLRKALEVVNPRAARRLEFGHVEAGIRLARDPRGTRVLDWPEQKIVFTPTVIEFPVRDDGKLGRRRPVPAWSRSLPGVGSHPLLDGRILRIEEHPVSRFRSSPPDPNVCWIDADKVDGPLTARTPRAGDRIHPLGMPSFTKVSRLLIARKIDREERNRIVLVLIGDIIVWIVGIRRAEYAKVDSTTRTVLRLDVRESIPRMHAEH